MMVRCFMSDFVESFLPAICFSMVGSMLFQRSFFEAKSSCGGAKS